MSLVTFDGYRTEAQRQWTQARRKALWSQFRTHLGSKPVNLLDFTELSRRFDLGNSFYRGVQDILLDQIVGSVGRYQDFVQTFLPVHESMSSRWQSVAAAYLDPSGGGLPPIEVYQVGDSYFVKDGNHRVSVAQQLKLGQIEAHVWEYFRPVAGLGPGADIDTLLLEAERSSFLQKTGLDELRPDHTIRLTAPGGYLEILCHIAYYQEVLSQIDGVEMAYEAAVCAWHDLIYETIVQLIEQTGVLETFPNRTAADFFIWVIAHHKELEEHCHKPMMIQDAVQDIRKAYHTDLITRAWGAFRYWLKHHR